MSDLDAPEKKCCNCRHWSKRGVLAGSRKEGYCRANPPVVPNNDDIGRWPVTYGDDWCGEFEPPFLDLESSTNDNGLSSAGEASR